MALTRTEKTVQVQELSQKMREAVSVMFARYIGLNVAELSKLRRQLRASRAEMKVAKKTLLRIAAKDAGLPPYDPTSVEGPVACIFSFADPLTGAQIAFKFGKDHPEVKLIGGIFDGKILSKEEATTLATLPGREVLLATFLGMLRSPLVQFASICNAPLSDFARSLGELAKKKGNA